jgi:hypothetical protein
MIKILLFTALAVACVSCDSGSKSVGSTEASALPYAYWGMGRIARMLPSHFANLQKRRSRRLSA